MLLAAGCTGGLANVIKATIYLTDMGDYAALNSAWVEVFGKEGLGRGVGGGVVMPARTCVQVKGLPMGTDVSFSLGFGVV